MKKAIKIILALTFIIVLCVPAFASHNHDIEDLSNMEIISPDDSSFTDIQKQNIANHIMGTEVTISTYSILCTLFGHNYDVEVWTVIEHKYYSSVPRCLLSYCDVGICLRCEDVKITLLSNGRIPCCN